MRYANTLDLWLDVGQSGILHHGGQPAERPSFCAWPSREATAKPGAAVDLAGNRFSRRLQGPGTNVDQLAGNRRGRLRNTCGQDSLPLEIAQRRLRVTNPPQDAILPYMDALA